MAYILDSPIPRSRSRADKSGNDTFINHLHVCHSRENGNPENQPLEQSSHMNVLLINPNMSQTYYCFKYIIRSMVFYD
jgi:hypothetical protein